MSNINWGNMTPEQTKEIFAEALDYLSLEDIIAVLKDKLSLIDAAEVAAQLDDPHD